jgi:HD-like signal output (HDOD) protein
MPIPPATHIDNWCRLLASPSIPVLRRTRRALDALAKNIEQVSARDIANIAAQDPLMTAKLFALVAEKRSARSATEITSVEGCVFMIGVPPFFRAFANLRTAEERLRSTPHSLRGLLRVVRRSRKAATFAWDFAHWRTDLAIDEIAIAALLHDLAEMLVWCFAPALALQMEALLKKNPGMRSRAAQQAVLKFELHDLQLALFKRWQLPELLTDMMDDVNTTNSRICNILYAVNLARHSANGWNDPALPSDYEDIARLLNTSAAFVKTQIRTTDGLSKGRTVEEDPAQTAEGAGA